MYTRENWFSFGSTSSCVTHMEMKEWALFGCGAFFTFRHVDVVSVFLFGDWVTFIIHARAFFNLFRCVHKRFRSCSSRGAHIIESEGQYFTSLFTLPALHPKKMKQQLREKTSEREWWNSKNVKNVSFYVSPESAPALDADKLCNWINILFIMQFFVLNSLH